MHCQKEGLKTVLGRGKAWVARRVLNRFPAELKDLGLCGLKGETWRVETARKDLLEKLGQGDFSNDSLRLAWQVEKFVSENKGAVKKELFNSAMPKAKLLVGEMVEERVSKDSVFFLEREFKEHIGAVKENISRFLMGEK